jgi:hypothetical protein
MGYLIMPDRFASALLAALNESAEVKESDWNSIEAVLRGSLNLVDTEPQLASAQISENRFAATVSSGMAKIRSGR